MSKTELFVRKQKGGMFTVVNEGKSTGNIYWVDSNSSTGANASGYGQNPDAPFLSLAYAITQCTANNGDRIFLMPNHAETVVAAGGITANVVGVSVIGLGWGSNRPRITFGTSVVASLLVTAANFSIQNVIGIAGIDALTNPIHVQAADCEIDMEWRDGAANIEALRAILTTAAADRLKVNLVYRGFTNGSSGVNAIRLVGVDGARVYVDYFGIVTTAVVEMETTASTNVDVKGRFYVHGVTDLSRNVVDTVGGSTWTVDGFDSPAGAHFSGGDAQAVAPDDVGALTARIGDLTNTGGADTLTAILGDPATVDLVTRFGNIQTEVDKIGDPLINTVASDLGAVLGDPGAGNTIESLIDDVQAEVDKIGDPLINTVASDLGAVLGDPGAGNTIESLIDDVQTEVDKIGIIENTAGTETIGGVFGDMDNTPIATRLSNILAAIARGAPFAYGTCDTGMTGSTTAIVSDDIAGYGDNFFNDRWYIQVLLNANAAGTAPEGETRLITNYVSATGAFTTAAFSQNVEEGDIILVLHESAVLIGADNADNVADTSNVIADGDGSVLERLEYAQAEVDKIDSGAVDEDPTANSLATFIATGGTSRGSTLPASASLYDMVRQYGDGYLATKEVTFTGASTEDAVFDVTGLVAVRIIGFCTTQMADHTDNLSLGVADALQSIIANTQSNALRPANKVWTSASPDFAASLIAPDVVTGRNIIATSTANVDSGVIMFYCFWKPLSNDGNVVAAT